MRIVISNPDGIGDAVLRLPLFEALRDAGHELLLICREPSRPLLERLGRGIGVAGLVENPYVETPNGLASFGVAPFEAARKFAPELLVFASYQWTVFEEQLAQVLLDVPRIRMDGHRYARGPNTGRVTMPAERERVVAVEADWHETVKNQAMCRAILGNDVELKEPRIAITEEDIERGRACLRNLFGGDAAPQDFWIGCVGNAGDYAGEVRDWGQKNWEELLRYMGGELGLKVVLVGNQAERDSLEKLRARAGIEGNIQVAAGEAREAADLSRLLGLTWLAKAYIGKDTGPMHIAAAMEKPVVAVFGGGTWPRFTPVVTPSYAVTVDMPCTRCGWVCHLPESLCVKRVPMGMVKEAVAAVASGTASGREIRVIAPSAEMIEESRRSLLQERVALQVKNDGERIQMQEQMVQNNANTAATIDAMKTSLLAAVSEARAEMAELRRGHDREQKFMEQAIQSNASMVASIEALKSEFLAEIKELKSQVAEKAAAATEAEQKRIAQLQQELKAMVQAAIDREREYVKRDSEWRDQVLSAVTQVRTANLEANQLSNKLASAERANRELTAKANAAQLFEARAMELSRSRSRRWLLKLRLVSRCPWEAP